MIGGRNDKKSQGAEMIGGRNVVPPLPLLRFTNLLGRVDCLVLKAREYVELADSNHAAYLRAIPHLVFHGSFRHWPDNWIGQQLLCGSGYPGRVVFRHGPGSESTIMGVVEAAKFLLNVRQYFMTNGEEDMAKDFLLIHEKPGRVEALVPSWEEMLGAPTMAYVRMDEWWREAADGESPLHDYYRLLEGSEWAVWHVWGQHSPSRYLRVMYRIRGGDERVATAIHFQVVDA